MTHEPSAAGILSISLLAPVIAASALLQLIFSISTGLNILIVLVVSLLSGLVVTHVFRDHETMGLHAGVWVSSAFAVFFAASSGIKYLLDAIQAHAAAMETAGQVANSPFGTIMSQQLGFAVALLAFNIPLIYAYVTHEHEAKQMLWYAIPAGLFIVCSWFAHRLVGQVITSVG